MEQKFDQLRAVNLNLTFLSECASKSFEEKVKKILIKCVEDTL